VDFGKFLGDVGNFFGGFFGGSQKKKDDDERRRQIVAQRQSQPSRPATSSGGSIQMPGSFVPEQSRQSFELPQLGGVNQKKKEEDSKKASGVKLKVKEASPVKVAPVAAKPKGILDLNLSSQKYNPQLDLTPKTVTKPQPKEKNKDDRPFLEKLVAGLQQGAGRVVDTALQGGGVLTDFGIRSNPFISEKRREENLRKSLATSEAIRGMINKTEDISGNPLLGNRDVDESAARIARGQGTAQDFAAVGGRGLDVAGTTTMLINPARTLSTTATVASPMRSLIPVVAKEATLYGGLEGTQATADTYGQTGDLNEALQQFAPNFLLGAGSQIGLEAVAAGLGRLTRDVAGRTPVVKSVERSAEDALKNADEVLPKPIVGDPEAFKIDVPARIEKLPDPNSPIMAAKTKMQPPAITSPNRPSVPAPKNEVVSFNQRPHEVIDSLKTEGDTKYLLRDESGKNTWTNQAGLDTARQTPVEPIVPNAALVAEPTPTVTDTKTPLDIKSEEVITQPTAIDQAAVAADVSKAAAKDVPTNASVDELGTIARKTVSEGKLTNDVDAQVLSNRVGDAIEAAAQRTGSTWEEINKKIQAAWSRGLKSYKDAGLTKEQFDVARKAADELSLLRQRVDPSLIGEGEVGQFYSPRQASDTEFTQELVNEIKRDRGGGLRDNELDLSTTPYRQAIRRYSNAPEAVTDILVDSVENKIVKDALGNETFVETGIKVPEDVKAAFKEDLKPYIAAQDDAIRAADAGDAAGIDKAIATGDKAIDDALVRMAERLPKDTVEARDAIANMISERRAYMQSTVRTNMFSNVVNRLFDQSQKAVVNFGDIALPLVNKISNKITGSSQPGVATDFAATRLANKYAKGTLIKQQNRNFKTNVRLAGATARNPVTKALAKADAAYRSAGTYLTSLGDLSTNAVKATNLAIIGKGRAEGLTTAAELESYLINNINSPEYLDIYRNMSNTYSGYIGMPQTLTSTGQKGGKASEFFSKVDNLTKNALDKTPLPDRVKQEINDLIMPSITGFAAATSRIAAKQLNALALGIPNIRRGMKLAASDSPNAKAIGEMMVSRSIIDGVLAGGVMGAGTLLGSTGHWTGEYPSDPNERARWESEGIQPESFSFEIDGKTVYAQPGRIVGVLALPMVIPAVVADAVKNGTDPAQAVTSAVAGIVKQFNENLGADAIIQHVGDVDKLINGSEYEKKAASKSLMNMLGFAISNVNPASGLQNNIANAADPYKRDTSGGVLDVVTARNPFTRQSLEVKTDNLGNPIANNTQLSLGSSALTVGDGSSDTKGEADKLEAEISRLSQGDFEVMPARDVTNTASQDDARLLMAGDIYSSADDETKAAMLHDALLGTRTKDISPDLSDVDRTALIEYKLQSQEKRKAWLDDNANASTYYTAAYNNLDAGGTLTADDNDLQNKSGARYEMVEAQVNEQLGASSDLKALYDQISQSDFKKMFDPDSEDYDPEKANLLFKYDEARTKAGVSDNKFTDKPKYSLKFNAGGGRGGRGGRGGSGKFAFASMPESLVGVNDGAKYDSVGPTFKPIADLQAPAAVVPTGRSISVKKGIQI